MKIVVNSRFLCQPLTGIQRFAIEISLWLKAQFKDEIVFVTPSGITQTDIAEKLDAKIIGTHSGQIWEQWDLLKYLNKNGKPLLLCLSGGAPVFYKNLIFSLHDIVYIRYPQSYSFGYRLFYKILMPPVLRHAKSVITVSEFSKKEISDYYKVPMEKIHVVYNAVSDIFNNVQREEDASTDNEVPAARYFLAVSSPAYHKNFPFLVQSFLQADLSDDIQLYIVGKLDSSLYRPGQLPDGMEDNPRIHFLGRVSDEQLVQLYSKALAFVFPSLYEGFGIPPLEAQACRCLVLSSDKASLPEVLQDSALYFSPDKVETLVRQLQFALDPKNDYIVESLRLRGMHNVERFGWQFSAQKTAEIINSIIE